MYHSFVKLVKRLPCSIETDNTVYNRTTEFTLGYETLTDTRLTEESFRITMKDNVNTTQVGEENFKLTD